MARSSPSAAGQIKGRARSGEVLLEQGKGNAVGAAQADALRPLEQVDPQHGEAVRRRPPAYRQQVLVDDQFLVRAQPGDVESQSRVAAVNVPEALIRKGAQGRVGQRFDAVRRGLTQLMLQADEVAWQEKIEYLTPSVVQGAIAEGPARQQRIKRAAGIAFAHDSVAGPYLHLALPDGLNKFDFLRAIGGKGAALAQGTVGAGDLLIHRSVTANTLLGIVADYA